VGGELTYQYLGNNQYEITLMMFRDCSSNNTLGTGFDDAVSIGIFNSGNGNLVNGGISIPLDGLNVTSVPISIDNPCFTLPEDLCVEQAIYKQIVTLQPNGWGYDLSYQRCCRNPSIVNLDVPNQQGITCTAHIPGTNETAGFNSSPVFSSMPPAALCQYASFVIDQSATDADGDELVYSFCSPLVGANTDQPAPNPPDAPPYTTVNWANSFNGSNPITSNPQISIDPSTGIITGTATALGQFVVGICVSEYRDGVLLNTVLRDFQINVTSCDPNIVASVPAQSEFCGGLEYTFQNSSINATSFHWDFGVANSNSDTSNAVTPVFTFPEPGTYTITLIANPTWPCADTVSTTHIAYDFINPVIDYGNYQCINGQDYYDFSVSGNITNAAGISWNFGAGAQPTTSSSAMPMEVMMNNEALQNLVSVTVSQNGCVEGDEEIIINNPNPIADFPVQTEFCQGLLVTMTNNSSNAEEYYWDFGASASGDNSADPSPVFQYIQPGTYQIRLIASSDLACADTLTREYQIYLPVTPSFETPPAECAGSASFDFEANGANSPDAIYTWSFGEDASPSSSTNQNPQGIIMDSPGSHTITLVINDHGCTGSFTDSVIVAQQLMTLFEVSEVETCLGNSVYLTVEAVSNVTVFYHWDFGDGNASQSASPVHVYESPGIYSVTVSAHTEEGCYDSLLLNFPNAVVIYPIPNANFSIVPQVMDYLDATCVVTSNTSPENSCYFTTSDGFQTEFCTFEHEWSETGTQFIRHTVVSPYGCSASSEGEVVITGFAHYIPNSFTPDGDGINDVWTPVIKGYSSGSLTIYNRWGEAVYNSDDLSKPWMGGAIGSDYYVPNGIYNYILSFNDLQGLPHRLAGYISVIR
jgi:gliding motility-associated-like protein